MPQNAQKYLSENEPYPRAYRRIESFIYRMTFVLFVAKLRRNNIQIVASILTLSVTQQTMRLVRSLCICEDIQRSL